MAENLPANCAEFVLTARGDERGQLIAIEGGQQFPFVIQRVYYIFDTVPGTVRGHHAHLALNQMAICVHGSCTMLLDDGSNRWRVSLDSPQKALRIGPMIWREMHDFVPGTVLMVLADAKYDESDYIRDYNVFLHACGKLT